MNKERVQKWIAALRSGNYKKTTGALHRKDNTHCVWGVGCDLFIKETGKAKWEEPDDGDYYGGDYYEFQGNEGSFFAVAVPPEVKEFYDFKDDLAVLMMCKNDESNLSFSELADYLESLL